jgi:hypothetical protein
MARRPRRLARQVIRFFEHSTVGSKTLRPEIDRKPGMQLRGDMGRFEKATQLMDEVSGTRCPTRNFVDLLSAKIKVGSNTSMRESFPDWHMRINNQFRGSLTHWPCLVGVKIDEK